MSTPNALGFIVCVTSWRTTLASSACPTFHALPRLLPGLPRHRLQRHHHCHPPCYSFPLLFNLAPYPPQYHPSTTPQATPLREQRCTTVGLAVAQTAPTYTYTAHTTTPRICHYVNFTPLFQRQLLRTAHRRTAHPCGHLNINQ